MSNSPWKEDKKLDAILKLDQTAKLCQESSQASALWQYGLWSFQTGDTKLERFLPRINITKGNDCTYFDFWINSELSKCAKI